MNILTFYICIFCHPKISSAKSAKGNHENDMSLQKYVNELKNQNKHSQPLGSKVHFTNILQHKSTDLNHP